MNDNTRTIIIRFDTIDENDAKALLELAAETFGPDAITEVPAAIPDEDADEPTPEPSGDQVAKEVWEGIVRVSAAETLATKDEAITSGKLAAPDAKSLEPKKEALRLTLTKEGVKGGVAAVVAKVIEWVFA